MAKKSKKKNKAPKERNWLASTPNSSSSKAFLEVQVKGGGVNSGRNNRTGWGSNVKTTAGPEYFAAKRFKASTIFA